MPKGMQCDVCQKFTAEDRMSSDSYLHVMRSMVVSGSPDRHVKTEATLCSAICLEDYAAAKVEAEIAAKAKAEAIEADTEAARLALIKTIERAKNAADMRHPQNPRGAVTINQYISGNSDPKAQS